MEQFKYVNTKTGEEVRDVDALDYVAEKCGFKVVSETAESKEFIACIVEWYFSVNWIQLEDDTDYGVTVTIQKDNVTSNDLLHMVASILGV